MNETGVTGSCMIIGLLMWRIQREEQVKSDKCELLNKVKNAETEIKELKRRRVEDAKANEKVVSMFSAHEQRWLMERKKLTQQIRALLHELRAISTKSKQHVSELCGQLQEKDKLLEEEKDKRREQEETVKKTEKINEELKEKLKHETQEHSKEIWKHKSAFIELVSTQRQLEAEMGRALRQIEAEKQELNGVLEQKEQYVLMTQKLSTELIKTRKDLEQKDKILSAMLRKSKLDSAEKQMLLKEVKKSKSKMVPESRNERYSLRNMLCRHHKSKLEQLELKEDQYSVSPFSQQSITDGSQELDVVGNIGELEGWVQCETEKYISVVEQRHEVEVNAFAEQLRLKEEKLEGFRWHSMSIDIEFKRLQSHIEGLGLDLTNLKQQNHKLEALLLDRESELHTLKEKMESELQLKSQKEKDQQVPLKDMVVAVQSPDKEFEDKKDILMDVISVGEECSRKKDIVNDDKNISTSSWKMDLHALGVFYKIKRLKQQLLMFERLTGKQENSENDDKKKLYSLVSLVNKQVTRYQSLQEKANNICNRMYENDQDASSGVKTKKLEHFLEETFQLQRYIVATGQKLIEIQSKIAFGFVGGSEDGFDMKKFGDCLRTLFREVQKGLEVRISRIIGDLEGPLAWDGMIHPTT